MNYKSQETIKAMFTVVCPKCGQKTKDNILLKKFTYKSENSETGTSFVVCRKCGEVKLRDFDVRCDR